MTLSAKKWFLIAAILLASATCWDVWEQDVFWQIRAGDEIISGHGIQQQDEWSYTALGRPWENIQWLATVLIRAAFACGDVFGLIGLRVLLTFGFFYLLMRCLRGSPWLSKDLSVSSVILAAACMFPMLAFKMEVRSDTFNFLIFGVVLWIWHYTEYSLNVKAWASIVMVVLAANLHAGTAPFIILLSVSLICAVKEWPWKRKILMSALCCLGILATPYGVRIFSTIRYIFFYSENNSLDNYDHYGLIYNEFALRNFGIATWIWVPFAICGWIGFAQAFLPKNKIRRSWYEVLSPMIVGIILTAYCIIRVRVFPYHALYFAPFFAVFLERIHLNKLTRTRILNSCLTTLGVIFGVLHINYFPLHYRFTYSSEAFPVGSAKFLARNTFKDPMLHTYGFGGYFVWWLRNHLDFADTRETIFWDLQKQLIEASSSEEKFHALIERYHINTAILPIPAPQYIENLGFLDAFASLLPQEEWSMVYFDDISVVFLRRIPEHTALIEEHSIRILKPNVPPGNYILSPRRTPENDRQFFKELERCRKEEPENIHCAVAASIAARKSKDQNKIREAKQALLDLQWKGKNSAPFALELKSN